MKESKFKKGDRVLYMGKELCAVVEPHHMVYPRYESWEYIVENSRGRFRALEEELSPMENNPLPIPQKRRRNKNRSKKGYVTE